MMRDSALNGVTPFCKGPSTALLCYQPHQCGTRLAHT
jgi:hypothetical protein